MNKKKSMQTLYDAIQENNYPQNLVKPYVQLGKSVSCSGTITNNCEGIVGSFGEFNEKLAVAGFACKRVLITYTLVDERGR